MLVIEGEKKIRQGYIARFNTERPKCADLLIVEAGKKRHYTAIKSLPALLRGVTSSNNGDFYCRNCLGSFRTREALDLHVEGCKDHDFCYVKMPEEGENILRYQEGSKSIRVPFVIYADTECILRPIQNVRDRSDKPSTCNVAEHVGCGAAMLIKFAYGEYERAFEQCMGENAITTFCKTLKQQVERVFLFTGFIYHDGFDLPESGDLVFVEVSIKPEICDIINMELEKEAPKRRKIRSKEKNTESNIKTKIHE